MNIERTIGAVALAAVAAVGYGDDAGCSAEREISGTGTVVEGPLNLTNVWDKVNRDEVPILWSSLGWGRDSEQPAGKTVTLQILPPSGGEAETLADGLKGYQKTMLWMPDVETPQVYGIRHVITGGSPLETPLNARFSFENCKFDMPSGAEVRAAIRSDDGMGLSYAVANDANNWWTIAEDPDKGIKAPTGSSTFAIAVDGHGVLRFDYALGGGTWTVKVDGVVVRTMDAAEDWTGAELPLEGHCTRHVIEFATDLPADAAFAALGNVRWVDEDDRIVGGQEVNGPVDLRKGVLVVRRSYELLPFAWSAINFTGDFLNKDTGFVPIDPSSLASVRVVQLTGEGEDVSQWTTEVAGTEKVLQEESSGEGVVKWKGVTPGVWKAEFNITTDGTPAYSEQRTLDLRHYVGPGLILMVL